jgi:sugar phosphate isomerase/epimerase
MKHREPNAPLVGAAVGRRAALRLLTVGVAGGTLLPHLARAANAPSALGIERIERIERIGLQLYTVRRALAKDLDGTLAAIAAAGVRELEFGGYYNKPPAWWRAALGTHGLTAPATHIGLPRTDAEWAPHFAAAKAMEHNWVIVPWLAPEARRTADDWKRMADRLNAGGEMAERAGLNFGYHNHDFEFAPVDGTTGYEILLSRTDPKLVDFELDIYWAVKAGQDPLAMLARWPGRYTCCHVKDAGPAPERAMLDVGAGTIDFNAIIELGRPAGLRHWFIEHDNPADPIASVRASALAMMNL